jgi:DNA polymerase epsilon subunit 1
MHDGHLLSSETYIGGHVEALESGVFRSDIKCHFRIVPEAIQKLIDNIDNALEHAIVNEEKRDMSTILNYAEERDKVGPAPSPQTWRSP